MVQGPKTDEAAILNVWNDGEDLELQFSEIAEKTKAVVSERTLISYLNALVKERILAKRVDEERRTFYRLSTKGKNLLLERNIVEHTSSSSSKFFLKLETQNGLVEGFLCLDEAHNDKADTVVDEIKRVKALNHLVRFFQVLEEAGLDYVSLILRFKRRKKSERLKRGEEERIASK